MNQAIQFDNELTINATSNTVIFNAQQSGQVLRCFIGFDVLAQLAQIEMVNVDNANEVFESFRFDIEDLAETLIKQERFNDLGELIISN